MSAGDGVLEHTLDGVRVARSYGDLAREVGAIREAVALSELPHVACVRVAGDGAYDYLERVCPAPLHIRDGQITHTLLLGADARPLADLYVANDDGAYLLLSEGLPAAALRAHLAEQRRASEDVALDDLSATHTVLSLNGPFAWELVAALDGAEAVGFPYLSFYRPAPGRITFRAGKTGEFGYDLLVPREAAAGLLAQLEDRGRAYGLARAGTDALWHCALENWFFNVHLEGRAGLTPLELQLQWRLDPARDFVGRAALEAHRREGFRARIAGIVAAHDLARGDAIHLGDARLGEVLVGARSVTTGGATGVALIDRGYSHSGIDAFTVLTPAGERFAIRTVSPPFVNNRSLFVSPQRHAYAVRHEVPFPGAARVTPP